METIHQHSPQAGSKKTEGERTRRQKNHNEWMDVLLFYVLPFVVINGLLFTLVAASPHISIRVADTKDYRSTTVTVTVKSLLPITEFTSTQEGTPLELTDEGKGVYTAQIIQNGVIEINAKSVNGMVAMAYEHVNILDDISPLVGEQYAINDGILTLTLEDSQSGLDYQSVYAVTASGSTLFPSAIDKQTGTFSFEMGEESLIIFANDLAGNAMQATFNTHMEMLNPDGTEGNAFLPDGNEAEGNPALPAENPSVEDAVPPAEPAPEETVPAETSGSATIYIGAAAPRYLFEKS